jgi:hypothetical protein
LYDLFDDGIPIREEWSTHFTQFLCSWLAAIMENTGSRTWRQEGDTVVHRLVTDAAVCVHEEGGRVDDR